jgi:hypothetical protein
MSFSSSKLSGLIPVDSLLGPGGDAVSGLTSSPVSQAVNSNFSIPSAGGLAGELVGKLASSGATPTFNTVTKGIGLIDSKGIANVFNVDTGKLLAKLPPISVAGGVPANLVPAGGGDNTEKFKAKLTANAGGGEVIFTVMPTISESHSASYEPFGPAHHPGEILKYKSTPSRGWNVNVKLISRNAGEAAQNLRIINTLRSWTMPFYGTGTERSNSALLGAPPPILTFSAYGPNTIGPVPTVLENYSWTWPNDVDYIEADFNGDGVLTPFPVIIDLTLALKESWSPSEFSNFDIASYRRGDMNGAFRNMPMSSGKPGTDASAKMGAAAKAAQKSSIVSEAVDKLPTMFQKADIIRNRAGNIQAEADKLAAAKPITNITGGTT